MIFVRTMSSSWQCGVASRVQVGADARPVAARSGDGKTVGDCAAAHAKHGTQQQDAIDRWIDHAVAVEVSDPGAHQITRILFRPVVRRSAGTRCAGRAHGDTGTARALHIGRATQVWQIEMRDDAGRMTCIARITMAVLGERG